MHEYHFGPLALKSTLALPELCAITSDSPPTKDAVTIEANDDGLVAHFSPTHTDHRSAYALMVDDQSGTATMRHEDAVDYVISPELDHVAVRATDAATASTVRHFLLDQVLPRMLEARGAFVLHASGVETDRGGMLFLGESGTGKSSLVAGFERAGNRRLGDDCFTIELVDGVLTAATTYPSLRLLPDAISEFVDPGSVTLSEVGANRPKQRVDQDRTRPPRAGSIDAIFVIDIEAEHQGPPAIRPLPARHGIVQLVANSFRFHNDAGAARRSLALAESILDTVPLYDLRYERSYAQLGQVVAAIMDAPEFAS